MLHLVANFAATIGMTGLVIPSAMANCQLPAPCPIFTPHSRRPSPSYKCTLQTQLAALKIGTSKAICNMVNR
jgi:hypothetical protein